MKKLLFYSLIVIVFGAIGFLIYLDQQNVDPEILTIETAYTIMDDEPTLGIMIYIKGEHPIQHPESIETLSITSGSDDIDMDVSLEKIHDQGSEVYLNQTYEIYLYDLKLPTFDQTVQIHDAIFEIHCINGETYELKIGKISISPSRPTDGYLEWKTLSGVKVDQTIFERIGCVEIGFFELHQDIKGFFDGFNYSEKFQIKDDILYLYIDDEPFVFQSFPIEIIFTDGTSQQIPLFIYMNSYQLLKMSGPLIHTYDFNSAI
jgi:hypothetical protein